MCFLHLVKAKDFVLSKWRKNWSSEKISRGQQGCAVSQLHICVLPHLLATLLSKFLCGPAIPEVTVLLFPVCFQGVQVDGRLFLTACLKTYRTCVAEIHKGLTLLQNFTVKGLKALKKRQ